MWKLIWVGVTTVFLSLSFGPYALSDEPPGQIKELYASYKTAMAQGDYRLARVAAEDAWAVSEVKYGDAKQTGDFAYNYAVLGKSLTGANRSKKIEKAFERSLALAGLHGEKADAITLRRHVEFASYWLQIGKRKKAHILLESADGQVSSSGLAQTKAYAKFLSLKSNLAYTQKNYLAAETNAAAAISTYEELGMSQTKKAYIAHYNLALAQSKLKKWREAMLGFEKIYTNVDGALPPKSPLIGRAFLQISGPRSEYMEDNNLEYVDLRRVLKCARCWPKFDMKYLPNLEKTYGWEVERHPPKMPRTALSSGFVVLMYDINAKGKAENIRLLQASHAKTFDSASVAALQRWTFEKRAGEKTTVQTKDHVTQVTFILSDHRGRMLDFYGQAIED